MPLQEKDIEGFEGTYVIRSDGNVISKRTGKEETILSPQIQNGKVYVFLYNSKNKKYVKKTVMRLVADSFIPNPNKYSTVRALNCNMLDVSAENVRWVAWQKCIHCDRYCDTCSESRYSCVIDLENKEKQDKNIEEATKTIIANNVAAAGGIDKLRKSYRYIAQELQDGESVATIAKRYGCTVQYVYRIRKRLLENDTTLRS